MEEHVVDASTEHQVDIGFQLRETRAEMLCQPGERLTRCERFTADMSSRWGIFQHGEVGVVLTRLSWILTQTFDAELREPEAFDFRNIHCSIAINQVGRRTMRLIAGDGSVSMCPSRPLLGKVLE